MENACVVQIPRISWLLLFLFKMTNFKHVVASLKQEQF